MLVLNDECKMMNDEYLTQLILVNIFIFSEPQKSYSGKSVAN